MVTENPLISKRSCLNTFLDNNRQNQKQLIGEANEQDAFSSNSLYLSIEIEIS
jgi:hypothetical protein